MKLLDFQRPGVAFLVRNRHALLADPPGLGKTAQLIRTLQVLAEMGEDPFPALVVCPNSLKSSTWSSELTKWAPELTVQVVDGTATQRRKQLDHVRQLSEGGNGPCPTHGQQNAGTVPTTPEVFAEAATKRISDPVTLSTHNGNGTTLPDGIRIQETGRDDKSSLEETTSSPPSESLQRSMTNDWLPKVVGACSADPTAISSTTMTAGAVQASKVAGSAGEASSAAGATSSSDTRKNRKTAASGSSGPVCTCPVPVVAIINWEGVRGHSAVAGYGTIALADKDRAPKEFQEMAFRTVIADEAHKGKDPKAVQTRALWAVLRSAEFRFLATGTPGPVQDLWALLHAIEPEWFPARTKYLDRFADTSVNYFGGLDVHGIKPANRDEYFKIVDPLMRRIPKEAALPQLPPVLPTAIRHTPMLPKQKKAYEQMRLHMIAQLDDLLVAPNPLAQLGRLNQLASAYGEMVPCTRREKQEVRRDGQLVEETVEVESTRLQLTAPSPKVDDMVDLLEEMGDEPLVVAAVSRQLVELAAERLERLNIPHGLVTGAQSGYERGQAIDRFQDGRHRVILLTLGAGAEGITLTRAQRMLFMQTSYSEVQNIQARDRIHRIGSERHSSIQIIEQITPGTVEEHRKELLATKALHMEEVVRDRTTLLRLLGEAA